MQRLDLFVDGLFCLFFGDSERYFIEVFPIRNLDDETLKKEAEKDDNDDDDEDDEE